MKRFGWIAGGVLLVIGLAVGVGRLLPQQKNVYDFIVLYSASLGVIQRVPIYDNAAILQLTIARLSLKSDFSLFPYPYPPWTALSGFYLGFLPVFWAANAWMLLNIAMLEASVFLLSAGWKPADRIALGLAALIFIPALGLIVVGQYSAPVLLGAALFCYAARREQAGLAATGLLLTTFKPHIGLFLLPVCFLWLVFQRTPFARKAMWWALGGAGALAALGFIADPAWPQDYLRSLLSFSAIPGVANRDLSASLPVLLVKLLAGQSIAVWAACLGGGLAVLLLLLFWRFGIFKNIEALVAGVILLTLLCSPYLFNYDYVLLLLPLIYLATKVRGLVARLLLAVTYLLPWLSLALSREANVLYAGSAILLVILLLRSGNQCRRQQD